MLLLLLLPKNKSKSIDLLFSLLPRVVALLLLVGVNWGLLAIEGWLLHNVGGLLVGDHRLRLLWVSTAVVVVTAFPSTVAAGLLVVELAVAAAGLIVGGSAPR